jgi:hypothetical protein
MLGPGLALRTAESHQSGPGGDLGRHKGVYRWGTPFHPVPPEHLKADTEWGPSSLLSSFMGSWPSHNTDPDQIAGGQQSIPGVWPTFSGPGDHRGE